MAPGGDGRQTVATCDATCASDRSPPDEVRQELLDSIATSLGAFTTPPLATVAVDLLGEGAAPGLLGYGATDVGRVDESASLVAAALEHVGSPATYPVREEDRVALEAMLRVARRLRPSR